MSDQRLTGAPGAPCAALFWQRNWAAHPASAKPEATLLVTRMGWRAAALLCLASAGGVQGPRRGAGQSSGAQPPPSICWEAYKVYNRIEKKRLNNQREESEARADREKQSSAQEGTAEAREGKA